MGRRERSKAGVLDNISYAMSYGNELSEEKLYAIHAASLDVLMEIGVLPKEKYEDWRRGRIDYLERVCTVNLRKLSFIMRQIRAYAQKSGLKPSVTIYKQWAVKKESGQGHKPVIRLRFSKSGDPDIERWYSTHFVDTKKIAELKAQRMTEATPNAAEHAAEN